MSYIRRFRDRRPRPPAGRRSPTTPPASTRSSSSWAPCAWLRAWGDDVPDGKVTDFQRAVQATERGNGAFSADRMARQGDRDAGMKKMMEDPRMEGTCRCPSMASA